jgi:hypothetical protein
MKRGSIVPLENSQYMKRFVAISEYKRMTGLSYPTIMHMIETNQCKYIQTECGHYKIDTGDLEDREIASILEQLSEQGQLIKALCGHLGVSAKGIKIKKQAGGM